ncbi:MAG TPA: glycerophosphodiester phosphodiesterase family protein [Armatimonadota bacterium]|nr:glycerophosphodiester phosphodiesterase family protein [Armatimonadota bacterium]
MALKPPVFQVMKEPVIVAHRGTSGTAPENTLVAFRRAIELGFTALELDVHRTADGEIVVMHDGKVDRTTDGSGLLSEMTLAQVKALDAGSWKDAEFAGERVPTLKEVCDLVRGRAFTLVEIKDEGITDEVLRVLQDEKYDDQVAIISFSADNMRRTHELRPDIPAGFLTGKAEDLALAEEMGMDALCLEYHAATADVARALHAKNMVLNVWTMDNPEAVREMAAIGGDFLTSNFPEMARDALK